MVYIIQHIWHMGEIPKELGWTVLVLIPKGTKETWGIGILKTLWKVVEALIDTCLCPSLQFYDVLHGFRDGGGTGADIM